MKTLALFISLGISSTAFCVIDTLEVSSKIKDVTVFFSGAQITRTAKIKAPKGKHRLVLNELPNTIYYQSIQVKSTENCKILSVKHELVYPSTKKSSAEKVLENKIESLELEMKSISNQFNVFTLEQQLLLDNRKLNKNKEGSAIDDIKKAADFYRERLNEIQQGKLNLSVEIDKKKEAIQELYTELNTLTIKKRNTYSKIVITIDCLTAINDDMSISYYVSSAGWTPNYDFRVDEITEPLNIVYNAEVYQSSGESWDKVNLKLSTNNPSLSGEQPELVTWILGRPNPYKKEIVQKGSGALKGRVLDEENKEPIPFAKILLKQNNQIIGGASSDFDGKYQIKPITTGSYVVEVENIGYKSNRITGVKINDSKITILDFELNSAVEMLEEVAVVMYKAPLIDKDGEASGGTVTRQDISRMPSRNAQSIAARGSRNKSDYYYIDGIKVKGDPVEATNYISNSLKTSITNLEYTIDIPYTIPSDGEDYSIKMKDVSLPVNYIYHAVPKLDEDAFLTAELTNWTALNLLPGKSNIYYQGTYIGESRIDTEKASDTLSISLGRDRNIVVKREGNKELFDKRVVGNYIKETVGWNITVRNNKDAKINIVIEDQFPVSERKSIEVDRLDYSGAVLNDKTGKLLWKIELNANEKKDLKFNYLVKYPKLSNIKL
ncbi:mucoidy inhibitor MuiA family protein [Crocinitomicaceae bacterium]|nr:mucoidy inhibitor MuiA family protein [Crocinitomicaceae bacterium]